jgi:hypothetical protein
MAVTAGMRRVALAGAASENFEVRRYRAPSPDVGRKIQRCSPVTRKSMPEHIDAAPHAATRRRLILDGATESTADAWIAAWDAQAAQHGLSRDAGYWEAAWAWMAAERQRRTRPMLGRI